MPRTKRSTSSCKLQGVNACLPTSLCSRHYLSIISKAELNCPGTVIFPFFFLLVLLSSLHLSPHSLTHTPLDPNTLYLQPLTTITTHQLQHNYLPLPLTLTSTSYIRKQTCLSEGHSPSLYFITHPPPIHSPYSYHPLLGMYDIP